MDYILKSDPKWIAVANHPEKYTRGFRIVVSDTNQTPTQTPKKKRNGIILTRMQNLMPDLRKFADQHPNEVFFHIPENIE